LAVRFAALLLLTLTLGCSSLATGEEGDGQQELSRSASSSLVIIATVTPVPSRATPSLEAPAPIAAAEVLATAELVSAETEADEQAAAPEAVESAASPTPADTATPEGTPTPAATPTNTPSPTPERPTIVPLPGMSSPETQIFVDHNQIRDLAGLPRLRTHDTLMAIARERAQIMASLGQMTHYNADGSTVFGMMAVRGYSYVTGSENIHFNWGYSSHQSVHGAVEAWINSPSHYASMVNPNLGRIGIGIAQAADGTFYYSVVFSD
jgi:uncharacterized protein YkwD